MIFSLPCGAGRGGAVCLLVAALAAPLFAQTRYLHPRHIVTLGGAKTSDRLGWSVDVAGDVDRDGHPDFAVGAPGADPGGRTDAGSVFVRSGRDHSLLRVIPGSRAGDSLGHAVRGAGDVDKDGTPDLVIGIPGDDNPVADAGGVIVVSGKTWTVLHYWTGAKVSDQFGVAVDGGFDADNDGHSDIIVGALNDGTKAARAGKAVVYSGRTGKALHTFFGESVGDQLGVSVAGVGDLDKDGHDDVAAGAWKQDKIAQQAGMVRVYSGRTGAVLREWYGQKLDDLFGNSVSGAGDVDNDGTPDVIAGAFTAQRPLRHQGVVRVFSGASGKELWGFVGDTWGDFFGVAVSGAGDADRDGHDDVLIGAYGERDNGMGSGSVRLISGKTGKVLLKLDGAPYEGLGVSVAAAGDVNSDDWPDFLAGSSEDTPRFEGPGKAHLLTLHEQFLRADRCCVSLATGGAQNLLLQAGDAHAGRLYLVLGSASGTTPGIRVGAVTIPLNRDAYQSALLGAPNTLIAPSIGLLDGNGEQRARFRIAPLSRSLAGLTLHHAYLVLPQPVTGILHVSNAVPVRLK